MEKLRRIVLEVIQDVIAGRTDNHLTSSTSSKGASSRIYPFFSEIICLWDLGSLKSDFDF